MLPPPSPHRVHFENTCVVIPEIEEENSVLHFEKRSYVLPWRRVRSEDATNDPTPPGVINIRLPSIGRKHRRVPSAERGSPLQPCLRHSHSLSCSNSENLSISAASELGVSTLQPPSPSPSSSGHSQRRARTGTRRASLNSSATEDRVPLRECCTACIDSVNKGLQQDYHEHWSKGAQRRRRMSDSDNTPSPCGSSAFLKKAVKVDEVESRKSRRPAHIPAKLPPALLEHLCADDDESMLFPLPSPRRAGTPTCGTPLTLTPSATPPRGSSSPRRTPSPNSVTQALSRTHIDPTLVSKPLPSPPSSPSASGSELLAQYPDVDLLPSPRRAASESAANIPRKATGSLLNSPAPRLFGW
ncbi:hypothetical protein FRC17_001173 [Serendipita sp. 399]|nr:hypothetical protein FRC17_001173 [Serendipita sp. 399]